MSKSCGSSWQLIPLSGIYVGSLLVFDSPDVPLGTQKASLFLGNVPCLSIFS